ncbi:MAG TPA: plastocyanin/azurin family copper-binding protein, partial [Solirubrobacteraceae bacterium]
RCRAARHGGASSHAPTSGTPTGASATPLAGGVPSVPTTLGASAPTSSSAPGTGQAGEASPPSAPPTVPRVQITAVEYSFTLSRATVPAGKVILEFVNQGQDEHNLNVVPAEGPVAGAFANTPSKGISDQQVILRSGTYTLFCSLPEHKQKGMKATLLVE